MTAVFITGTDTGVGKTHVACHLLRDAKARDIRCVGFKPVAAGCRETPEGWRNDDALALQAAGNVTAAYEVLNPYALPEAASPHIAAAAAGIHIEVERIREAYVRLSSQADFIAIEGAGGWRVPVSEQLTMADIAMQMGWPVLLVVGMRLGCLNHALLSIDGICRHSRCIGWVANCLTPLRPHLRENIEYLSRQLPVPLLGVVPATGQRADGLGPRLTIDAVAGA